MSQNPENITATEVHCDRLTAYEVVAGRIVLCGLDGKRRGVFEVEGDRPRFELFDDNGETVLNLEVTTDGRPQITAFDAGGAARLDIGLTPDGEPTIQLADGHETRLSLHLRDGCAEVCHYNAEGELRSHLREKPDGEMEFLEFDGETTKGEDF